ncbi:MAG: hypothetical protein H7Z43_10880 [Clostridia bacterium]|nr:hypothetical protein [Deltaproteobacteria bacterium]
MGTPSATDDDQVQPDPEPQTEPIPAGPACVIVDSGIVDGVTHGLPVLGWAADVAPPASIAGPHAVREFDSCFGTDTGDPTVCVDTIDYIDPIGVTRRLPYRVTAPRDLAVRTPVLVHQHGGGPNPSGQRAYDNLVRSLASFGYVVVQTAVMPGCGTSNCGSLTAKEPYCAFFGQFESSDCEGFNVMYFNRPRDFAATLDALPRILANVDQLAETLSVDLATYADTSRVAIMGHSAGTNGVLSLAGAGFDYMSTVAGANVDQRDWFPSAFIAFGPNAHSSDNGRGWDTNGFASIAADVPFLFVTGSRDYARDVPACDRPQAFFEGNSGWKFMSYAPGTSHSGASLGNEDNLTVDTIAEDYWTPDRCSPDTYATRDGNDYGTNDSTTALETDVWFQVSSSVLSFLKAAVNDDSDARSALAATAVSAATIEGFDWTSTRLERRGEVAPVMKIVSPRGVTVGGASCGGSVFVELLRRGTSASVTLSVEGLPAGASAVTTGYAPGAVEAQIVVERGTAVVGDYRVRLVGASAEGTVLGTELTLRLR